MKRILTILVLLIVFATTGLFAQGIDWSRAKGSNPSNINPELARRLILLG